MVTDFQRESTKIGIPTVNPFSFCALAFHNGWEDRNLDARVNTADDTSMSNKNFVIFDTVTRERAFSLTRSNAVDRGTMSKIYHC